MEYVRLKGESVLQKKLAKKIKCFCLLSRKWVYVLSISAIKMNFCDYKMSSLELVTTQCRFENPGNLWNSPEEIKSKCMVILV